MRRYSIQQPGDFQTLKKYCIGIDNSIQAIVNFIDNFYPNYIVLNRYIRANQELIAYLSDAQLLDKNIIGQTNGITWFDLNKMKPHQIIENHFGTNCVIKNTNITIPQGYSLRHEGYNTKGEPLYSIISLASSGAYYTVDNIQYLDDGILLTWQLHENATDIYGLEYLFSIILPDERCYWHDEDNLYAFTSNTLSPVILVNWTGDQKIPKLATKTGAYWNINKIIFHDFIKKTTNTSSIQIEEIIEDGCWSTKVARVGESPQSRYTINTNIIGQPDLYINFC